MTLHVTTPRSLKLRWFLFLDFGVQVMAKSKNPFSRAVFNIKHQRTENVSFFNLPRFSTNQWRSSKHGAPMEFLYKFFFKSNVWCQIMFCFFLVSLHQFYCELKSLLKCGIHWSIFVFFVRAFQRQPFG